MDIVIPDFYGSIEWLMDLVMSIYKALYLTFGSNSFWSLLATRLELTLPNIFGDDIVVSFSILTMLFSYGITSFIVFSLWKWVRIALIG